MRSTSSSQSWCFKEELYLWKCKKDSKCSLRFYSPTTIKPKMLFLGKCRLSEEKDHRYRSKKKSSTKHKRKHKRCSKTRSNHVSSSRRRNVSLLPL
ncbi:unnamed protein product [Peronospora belbahrii]|uniref:Uncharacterized protein n=1 Tax=Peronospora belbahrii TaxID=622444 RepID=A0ABN8CV47_9STRA|nr:unnamed protein product [Peronospora belbahrii]